MTGKLHGDSATTREAPLERHMRGRETPETLDVHMLPVPSKTGAGAVKGFQLLDLHVPPASGKAGPGAFMQGV